MARIRVWDKRLARRVVDKSNVHHLFFVRNMFFPGFGRWPGFRPHWPGLKMQRPDLEV
jgi:hypothetical protein